MATLGCLTELSWHDLGRSDGAAGPVVEALADFGGVLLRDCPAQRNTPPSALWGVVAELFRLPRSILLDYALTDLKNEGGYIDSGIHGGTLLPRGWHVVGEAKPALEGRRTPNVWPTEVPRLRDVLVPYCAALSATAEAVLSAVARFYDRSPDHFAELRSGGADDVLRLLHYRAEPGGPTFGMAPHRDLSLVSLFVPSTDPGLEAETRPGEWQALAVPNDALLVGVGGAIARLTNGEIPELHHRVRGLDGVQERYSASFFVNPRSDVPLTHLRQPPGRSATAAADDRFDAWFRRHTGTRWSEVCSPDDGS